MREGKESVASPLSLWTDDLLRPPSWRVHAHQDKLTVLTDKISGGSRVLPKRDKVYLAEMATMPWLRWDLSSRNHRMGNRSGPTTPHWPPTRVHPRVNTRPGSLSASHGVKFHKPCIPPQRWHFFGEFLEWSGTQEVWPFYPADMRVIQKRWFHLLNWTRGGLKHIRFCTVGGMGIKKIRSGIQK